MGALYEIVKDISDLLGNLDEYDTHDSPEIEQITAALDRLDLERTTKLNSICAYVRETELTVDAIDAEISRLKKLRNTKTASIDWIKQYVGKCLNFQKWASPIHKIGYRKSQAVISTEDNAAAQIPDQYARVKVIREPDKTLMAKDLKCGAEIPGWKLEERINVQID